MTVTAKAAILPAVSGLFSIEELVLPEPSDDELLVKVAGCGICHTDVKVSLGYANVPLPVVLGHEGSGTVLAAGAHCGDFQEGDHVIMTFPSCGHCVSCREQHPAYCDIGQELSFACRRPERAHPGRSQGETIHGAFFGQSSFSTHALVSARNAVKVNKDLPLPSLGPLGCGFQTGAGAVLNVLQPPPGESLAVFGAGNVGLSAIMAARIADMGPVIALDINEERLALAKMLGATDVINLTIEKYPVEAIHQLSGGKGVRYSLDTTNRPEVIRQAFEGLGNRGTCIHSGGGGKDFTFPGSHLLHGRTVTGVIQGDSNPRVFIPQLLDYFSQGQFPFDRLLNFYPLEEINRALEEMEKGSVVKPVLRMS